MGSQIKINDTLKIRKERGFPAQLSLEEHLRNPDATLPKVTGIKFEFWNTDERLYHRPPTRVWLVEEIDGKWLYWGHALVRTQTIEPGKTYGEFEIIKIYDPEYQKQVTINESPAGKSYFETP